jgi:deoxyribodipyrimidine photolyase-related protein
MSQKYQRVRLILGDQLNANHSWFSSVEEDTAYCLFETWSEATYARHHVQKIVGFFLAMRAFGDHLEANGHRVIYRTLEETRELQLSSIAENLLDVAEEVGAKVIEYQLPDEYRLDELLKDMKEAFGGYRGGGRQRAFPQ